MAAWLMIIAIRDVATLRRMGEVAGPFVLVHGGFHGAWCWEPLIAHLAGPAVAVDLPGRGARPVQVASVTLDDCVRAVIDDADAAGFDRFVLVGHSLGGLTVTETAVRFPDRVAAVVYVAALIPRVGQSAGQLMGTEPDEMPVLPEPRARALFGTGMDDESWSASYARLVPESAALFNSTITAIPRGVSLTYVSMPLDAPVPPALVESMLAGVDVPIDRRVIDGAGHTVMATHPRELAAILNEFAAASATDH